MNDEAWYYVDQGRPVGPVSRGALLKELGGRLPAHTPVWRDGLPGWTPAAQQPELAALGSASLFPAPVVEPGGPTAVAGRRARTASRLGLILMGLGAICGLAAVVLGAVSAQRRIVARRVVAIPLVVGQRVETGWLEVDPTKLCQVTVHVRAATSVVSHNRRRRRRDEHEPMYHFPLRYRVLDASGNVFFEETTKVPSGISGPTKVRVRGEQGTVEGEHYYSKFTPPGSRRIKVTAELGPDAEHGAVAHAPELRVYDNVSPQLRMILSAVALGLLGATLVIAGGIVALFWRQTAPKDG
jgi:hypothetical protein